MRLLVAALLFLTSAAPAQRILHYAELNTRQIERLDKDHTAVLLTDGILEEHGPYLPSYTDGYWDERMTASLARSLARRPGWTVVTLPVLPLGTSPANIIARRYSFPGSLPVRAATLRAVFMDLADALGEAGFRHIFIVDSHGGPANSVVLDQVGDYFHSTWHGHMVHLLGLLPVQESAQALQQMLTPAQLAQNGMSVHADALEQSQALYVAPRFVSPAYRRAPALPGADVDGLMAQAARPDWPGYLGAPAYASAALGRRYFQQLTAETNRVANAILDGKLDAATLPRYGDAMFRMTPAIEVGVLHQEAKQLTRQQAWIAAHPSAIDRR